jgi:hypothetical protein
MSRLLQMYHFTNFTNLQIYKFTILQITILQIYNFTNLQFYKFTNLQIYNLTILQNERAPIISVYPILPSAAGAPPRSRDETIGVWDRLWGRVLLSRRRQCNLHKTGSIIFIVCLES